MRTRTLPSVGLFCFICFFTMETLAGGAPVREPGAPDSEAEASTESNPLYGEVDQIFKDMARLEAGFSQRCVQGRSRWAAAVSERYKNMDKEIEKVLDKRPPEPLPIEPEVESVVCDKHLPYIDVVKGLADINIRNSNEVVTTSLSYKYNCEAVGKNEHKAIAYYSCLAFAQNDESPCDLLKSVHQLRLPGGAWNPTPDVGCKSQMRQLQLSKALISNDPSAGKICREICGKEGLGAVLNDGQFPLRGDAGSCETICSLAVSYRDDPDRFCREALSQPFLKGSPLAVKSCKDKSFSLQVGLGGPLPMAAMIKMATHAMPGKGACSKGLPCFVMPHVLAYAGFRKAFTARNKELCGSSDFCRAMMGGGPRACQPIEDEARQSVCIQRVRAKKWNEWDVATKEKKSQLQDLVTKYNGECAKDLDQMRALYFKADIMLQKFDPITPGKKSRVVRLRSVWRRRNEPRFKFAPLVFPPPDSQPASAKAKTS